MDSKLISGTIKHHKGDNKLYLVNGKSRLDLVKAVKVFNEKRVNLTYSIIGQKESWKNVPIKRVSGFFKCEIKKWLIGYQTPDTIKVNPLYWVSFVVEGVEVSNELYNSDGKFLIMEVKFK
jgi:hypothetical protein